MCVTRREIRQNGGSCELVLFILVVDQLLPPSVCRTGDFGWLIRAKWRSIKDEGLDKEATNDGVHVILSLQ